MDWITGACIVTRREVLVSAGLLDERYFLYWEDVDWCLRLRRHGWRVVVYPPVAITHLGGASTGRAAPGHYYRSLVRFYRKWYGAAPALLLAALLPVYAPLAAALRRIRAYRR